MRHSRELNALPLISATFEFDGRGTEKFYRLPKGKTRWVVNDTHFITKVEMNGRKLEEDKDYKITREGLGVSHLHFMRLEDGDDD